jgi:hypothetical protein
MLQQEDSRVIFKPTDLLGTEVLDAEVRFCASSFDNQDGRSGAAMYLHFYLSGCPDSPRFAQTEVGEFLYASPIFGRFFHIDGVVDRVVEPGLDLGIARMI